MSTEAVELLDRGAESSALEDRIADARAGRGGFVIVEGPAGIGKTSLLDVTRARADAAGMAVLAARGSALEQDLPFGVVRQLMDAAPARRRHGRAHAPVRRRGGALPAAAARRGRCRLRRRRRGRRAPALALLAARDAGRRHAAPRHDRRRALGRLALARPRRLPHVTPARARAARAGGDAPAAARLASGAARRAGARDVADPRAAVGRRRGDRRGRPIAQPARPGVRRRLPRGDGREPVLRAASSSASWRRRASRRPPRRQPTYAGSDRGEWPAGCSRASASWRRTRSLSPARSRCWATTPSCVTSRRSRG